jgi:S1-C subfamily serine protease
VVEQPRDFDDWRDEEPRRPLLPREDRLWRHPSEVGSEILSERQREVIVARRRWLASTPTRAGAGTAGVVGALLATGVVLVGTHLSSWLTPPAASSSVKSSGLRMAALADVTTTSAATIVGTALTGEVASIEAAVVRVVAVGDHGSMQADGVLVSPRGYVVVPASAVAGARSVSVMRSDGEELIATVAGRDPETGIAVLHVDESGLPSLATSQARLLPVPSLMLVASWTSRIGVAVAPMRSSPEMTSVGAGPALLETCPSSLRLGSAPDGSVILDSEGHVVGMVVMHRDQRAIATPGWVIRRIAGLLASRGRVIHGWLGIEGSGTRVLLAARPPREVRARTHATHALLASEARSIAGVRVVRVDPKSAAALAGLRRGDVIESVNGHPVTSMASLQAVLYLMAPASTVRLELVRGGKLAEVDARLLPAA